MNLQYRIDLLTRMGQYLLSDDPGWKATLERAERENGWFISPFLQQAVHAVANRFLQKNALQQWAEQYQLPQQRDQVKDIGIVMAGNIPLVGFHDWLCCFVSGHRAVIKLSSKDAVLLRHLLEQLTTWEPRTADTFRLAEFLKGCDAYIATGSNNSAGYFEYYFSRYPHIIRRNRTSVAILEGNETGEELSSLADDVHLYFGLGCRNVTKLYVPEGYDFVPLLEAFRRYAHLADHHKYKNNYDYQLAMHILSKKFYMTNGSILVVEEPALFSPISQLHFEYYQDYNALISSLKGNNEIQAITGKNHIPFGQSQQPALNDYADGVDTLAFLRGL